jgi:DNA primase
MEIQDIKTRLTMANVIHYYGLKADKQSRLCCPFHEDKTPSLQIYYKTQTAFCFSTNCQTHGRAIDVIDFIMYKEAITKHEAIKKAVEIIAPVRPLADGENKPTTIKSPSIERAMFLERMFTYFKNGVSNSQPAQEYMQQRGLDFRKIEIGYNAGQFHHGARKDETLINECLKYGLLLDLNTKARTGEAAYKSFGKWCIVFALRNKENQITGLYFRSTLNDKEQRHFYLRDRQGLYPCYPKKETKRLIITESIIDAATLLQIEQITNNYEILSLYGTNGLMEEHQTAIRSLHQLEEIIFFLNGDEPGIKAVQKYGTMLKAEYKNLRITNVEAPHNEDVNSLLQGHAQEVLIHLIDTRKELDFLFSSEKINDDRTTPEGIEYDSDRSDPAMSAGAKAASTNDSNEKINEPITAGLNTSNPYNIVYQGKEAKYHIKGFKADQMDSLKVTLQIVQA